MKKDIMRFIKAKQKGYGRDLLSAMMLLDRKYIAGFEIQDFSKKSIREYEKSVRENYTAKQENILHSAIQYLTDAFPEKKRIKRKYIPFLIYLADEAEDAGIPPERFRRWFDLCTGKFSKF